MQREFRGFLCCSHACVCDSQDKKVKASVPVWLARELEALSRRLLAVSERNYIEYMSNWQKDCFGLRSLKPDEHPCSIMTLEVRIANEQLVPSACASPLSSPPDAPRVQPDRMVERYMHILSQGVGMCMAARSANVRVTNDRKRRKDSTDSNNSCNSDADEDDDGAATATTTDTNSNA